MEALWSESDCHWMELALAEAQAALAVGDYPVGAVLTVDGELWGQARNSLFSDGRFTAHAEHNLLYTLSPRIRTEYPSRPKWQVCLYTTLEPCLMCFGTAILHRVSRLVIACPDPNGGTTRLDPAALGSFYQSRWPEIHVGLYREEACELILAFLKTGRFLAWEHMLQEFQTLKASWSTNDAEGTFPPA